MFSVRCIVAALALLTAPALADEPNPATPTPEKKICRAELVTGSIMNRRTCRTKSEWAEIAARNAQATSRALEERNRR